MEDRIQSSWNDTDAAELARIQKELKQLFCWESDLLFQKTRAKWLQDGDRNTAFFHAVIRQRRCRNAIQLQDTNGVIVTHPQEVCSLAAPFYAQLFSATPYFIKEELFEQFHSDVTATMNTQLCAIPMADELMESIFSLSADSAPGMDGIT